MSVTLSFVDGEFKEGNVGGDKQFAKLEVTPSGSAGTAKLTFSGDAGLIARRTASRQAESVVKSGFLLASGERVGAGFELEVVEADNFSEAHLREGHKYNRG